MGRRRRLPCSAGVWSAHAEWQPPGASQAGRSSAAGGGCASAPGFHRFARRAPSDVRSWGGIGSYRDCSPLFAGVFGSRCSRGFIIAGSQAGGRASARDGRRVQGASQTPVAAQSDEKRTDAAQTDAAQPNADPPHRFSKNARHLVAEPTTGVGLSRICNQHNGGSCI